MIQHPPELVAVMDRANLAVEKINTYIDAANKAAKAGNRTAFLKAASGLAMWTSGELTWLTAHPFAACVAKQQEDYRTAIDSELKVAGYLRAAANSSGSEADALWTMIDLSEGLAHGSLVRLRIGILSSEPACQ